LSKGKTIFNNGVSFIIIILPHFRLFFFASGKMLYFTMFSLTLGDSNNYNKKSKLNDYKFPSIGLQKYMKNKFFYKKQEFQTSMSNIYFMQNGVI